MNIHKKAIKKIQKTPAIVLCAALCALLSFALGTAQYVMDTTKTEVQISMHDQISGSITRTSAYIEHNLKVVAQLAEKTIDYVGENPQPESFEKAAVFLSVFQESSVFSTIAIIAPDGTAWFDNGSRVLLKNNEYLYRALQGEIVISGVTTSFIDREPVVFFLAPVRRNNKVVAVVAAAQRTLDLQRYCTQNFFQGYGQTYFIADSGDLIVQSENTSKSARSFTHFFAWLETIHEGKSEAEQLVSSIKNDFIKNIMRVREITPYRRNTLIIGYNTLPIWPEWNILCIIDKKSIHTMSLHYLGKVFLFTGYLLFFLTVLVLVLYIVRKKNRYDLYKNAYLDPVTGGYNYTYFRKLAPSLIDRKKSYCILRLDICHFRYLNQSLGYQTGNRILKAVYDCLKNHCPEDEGYLAVRIINDEFIALCPDPDPLSNDPARDILRELIALPKTMDIPFNLQFFIGACRTGEAEHDLNRIIDYAFIAQKNFERAAVKKQYLFDLGMSKTAHLEDIIELNMEQALEQKEFEVFFQPKIDITTGKTVNAEALIRWNSPEFGFMSPGDFIPVFERNGFIQKLDFYVLDSVCATLAERMRNNLPIMPISVNQSRLHCYNPNYITDLLEIVTNHAVPFTALELEITESVVLENMDTLTRYFAALRSLGFSISIDDFGAGYTSLSFLRDIDVDVIKIDKSLADDADSSLKKRTMTRFIIQMSHELSMKVVCEGVETLEQVNMLREMGCDYIQGYYYSKPLPAHLFFKYIDAEETT